MDTEVTDQPPQTELPHESQWLKWRVVPGQDKTRYLTELTPEIFKLETEEATDRQWISVDLEKLPKKFSSLSYDAKVDLLVYFKDYFAHQVFVFESLVAIKAQADAGNNTLKDFEQRYELALQIGATITAQAPIVMQLLNDTDIHEEEDRLQGFQQNLQSVIDHQDQSTEAWYMDLYKILKPIEDMRASIK